MACTCDFPIEAATSRRGWSGEINRDRYCANCGESFVGRPVGAVTPGTRKTRRTAADRRALRDADFWRRRFRDRDLWNRSTASLYELEAGDRILVKNVSSPTLFDGPGANRANAGRAPLVNGTVYRVVRAGRLAKDGSWYGRTGVSRYVGGDWRKDTAVHLVREGGDSAALHYAHAGEFDFRILNRRRAAAR